MYHFIVNPTAGRGEAVRAMEQAEVVMENNNVEYKTYFTDCVGDGEKIARGLELENGDIVVSVGGDGSNQEIAKGLIGKQNAVLAFLPAGTGNDFCYAQKFGKDHKKNMQRILDASISEMDYIKGFDDNISLNMLSTGLDVEVIQTYNKAKKKSSLTYKTSTLKVLMNFKFKNFKILVDGKSIKGEFMLAAVCNGQQFGGGIKACPISDIADGKLDLVLIKKVPRYKILFMILKFLKGKHIGKKWVEHIKCETVEIVNGDDSDVISNYDGELKQKHFICNIVKGGLKVKI